MVSKAGLVQLNMRSMTPKMEFKKAVATNLSVAPKATGSESYVKVRGQQSGVIQQESIYNIGSQRTLKGTGAIYNPKAANSDSIALQRNGLNGSPRVIVHNKYSAYNPVYTPPSAGGLNASSLFATLNSLAASGVLNPTVKTQGSQGTQGTQGVGNTSSTSSSPELSAMKDAQDSTTLRGAIESAETKQSQMEADLQSIKDQLPDLKTAAEDASSKMEKLNTQISEKESNVSQTQDAFNSAQSNVNDAKRTKENAKNVLENFANAVGDAAINLNKALTGVEQAEAALSSTPKTIMSADGKEQPNPAYDQAMTNLDQAKDKETSARENLEKAEVAHEKSKANYEAQLAEYDEAKGELATAEKKLETAKTELETAEKALNALKKEKADANDQIAKYEAANKKQETLKSGIEDFQETIEEQKARLTQLEAQEKNELTNVKNNMDALSGKIGKRNASINTADGLNFIEKMKQKRNLKNSDNYDKLTQKRDELELKQAYTDLYNAKGEQHGGKTFRTGSYNGKTLYMIGAKKVDQATYEEALKKAKGTSEAA